MLGAALQPVQALAVSTNQGYNWGMIIEFLGSGTSHGIPVLGCSCPVCRSVDRADTRYRSALYIQADGGTSILIDCGPEFRLQALRAGISRIDAVLLTHAHADHLHGLDDLRPLTREHPIPLHANETATNEVLERFAYAFPRVDRAHRNEGGGKPRFHIETVSKSFSIDTLRITPIPLLHGSLEILGWRIEEKGKTLVYASDVKHIAGASRKLMSGADVLILGALRSREHSTHFSFAEAMEEVRRLKPGAAWFTHICHDHPHREIVRIVAPLAAPARDTLRILL